MLHSQQHLLSVFKIYTSMNEMVFSIVWVCIVFHGWQWCSALYYVLGMGIAWFPLNTCTMFFPPSSFLRFLPTSFLSSWSCCFLGWPWPLYFISTSLSWNERHYPGFLLIFCMLGIVGVPCTWDKLSGTELNSISFWFFFYI